MKIPNEDALLEQELTVINIGARMFFEDLHSQGVAAIHVVWQPPAGGQRDLMALLEKLGD